MWRRQSYATSSDPAEASFNAAEDKHTSDPKLIDQCVTLYIYNCRAVTVRIISPGFSGRYSADSSAIVATGRQCHSADCIYNDKHASHLISFWAARQPSLDRRVLYLCVDLCYCSEMVELAEGWCLSLSLSSPSSHITRWTLSLLARDPSRRPPSNPSMQVTHITAFFTLMHFNSINICFCLFSCNKHPLHL